MNEIPHILRNGNHTLTVRFCLSREETDSLAIFARYANRTMAQVLADQLDPLFAVRDMAKAETIPYDYEPGRMEHICADYADLPAEVRGERELRMIPCPHCGATGRVEIGTYSGDCAMCDGLLFVTTRD